MKRISCDGCQDPKISYISAGKGKCVCDGTITFEKEAARQAPLVIPTLGDLKEPDMAARRRTINRFTRVLAGNAMFECANCHCLRPSGTMMRFNDIEASRIDLVGARDWCGICVKSEVSHIAINKSELKRLWALIKEGIKPSAELSLAPLVEPTTASSKPRVRYKQTVTSVVRDEGPAPELTLVF